MSIALLDINDSNLQLWHGDRLLQSPGIALLEGQQYRFGLQARDAARLRPRDINSRYWWQLNTKPLQPALGPARHTADLVHAHLLDIHQQAGEPAEIILAASSSMQREQLSLLLGIIEQCPFSAVGLVNRSVALTSLEGGAGKFYHLEIQLHQAVVSELTAHQGIIELQHVFPLPGCGLLQLQDQLADIIGSAFIQQSRFDPRRSANSEQQLYDHLPEVLRALESSGEYHLDIAGHRVRISRNDLAQATASLYDSTVGVIDKSATGQHIMLDPLAASLPGFLAKFPSARRIRKNTLSEAVKQHQEQLLQRDQDLNFITSLPSLAPQNAAADSHKPDTSPQADKLEADKLEADSNPERPATATHLLAGDRAVPLLANGTRVNGHCELHLLDGHWQLRGEQLQSVSVNGVVYSPGQPLRCGDHISTAAGTRAALIEVTG